MPNVAIIMSTYNGQDYLKEQLDSVLIQADVDFKVYVRDDGSTDRTPEILIEYAQENERVIFLNPNERKNIGVRDSFLSSLKKVYDMSPDASYFAFSDQDDVWKKDKLSAAIKILKKNEYSDAKPKLYYSNKTIVDKKLNVIFEEHMKCYDKFFEIFWGTPAYGCTMVFNRAFCSQIIKINPKTSCANHDNYIYFIAKAIDAEIEFDETSYILYRQHSHNVSGIQSTAIGKTLARKRLKDIILKKNHTIQSVFLEIKDTYMESISDENMRRINWVLNYDKNFIDFLSLATDQMAFCRGPIFYIMWIVKLVLRKI